MEKKTHEGLVGTVGSIYTYTMTEGLLKSSEFDVVVFNPVSFCRQ